VGMYGVKMTNIFRRLLQLNGLAALMVPLHHATAFGLQAMFLWTDRYRPVPVPNYDQLGSPTYYILMATRHLDAFAIPAFLFVSGHFVAFLTRGREPRWKMFIPRIRTVLIPWVIWTAVRFILLQRLPGTIGEVLDTYYFVVLLIQYYLLSVWLVPLAKKHWKAVLFTALLIQLAWEFPWYLKTIGVSSAELEFLRNATTRWLAPARIFYFSLGVVAGLHVGALKRWLARAKWVLGGAVVLFAVLSFVEYEFLRRIAGQEWIGPNNPGFARVVYASIFSLWFLAFDKLPSGLAKVLAELGSRSLGIYFMNVPVAYIFAVLMYRFTPWALGFQPIYQIVLIVTGLGIPLMLMSAVKNHRTRRMYRYLFG